MVAFGWHPNRKHGVSLKSQPRAPFSSRNSERIAPSPSARRPAVKGPQSHPTSPPSFGTSKSVVSMRGLQLDASLAG